MTWATMSVGNLLQWNIASAPKPECIITVDSVGSHFPSLNKEKYLTFPKTCYHCGEEFKGSMENHRHPNDKDETLATGYACYAHVFGFNDSKTKKPVDFTVNGMYYYLTPTQQSESQSEGVRTPNQVNDAATGPTIPLGGFMPRPTLVKSAVKSSTTSPTSVVTKDAGQKSS